MLDVGNSHRLNSIPNLMNIMNKLTNMDKISNYNPFYLYGGDGMGNTQLLNAIGIELKKSEIFPFLKVTTPPIPR